MVSALVCSVGYAARRVGARDVSSPLCAEPADGSIPNAKVDAFML